MTKINFKNSKTKTTIAASLVTVFVLLSQTIIIPTINAQMQNQTDSVTIKDSKYYRGEFITIQQQIIQLEEQKQQLETQIKTLQGTPQAGNNTLQLQQQADVVTKEIGTLSKKLAPIQQQSRALFKVDNQTKAKFYADEKILIERYIDKTSKTYIGNNPVVLAFADLEHKDMVVILDPDQTINTANGKTIVANLVNDMEKLIGNIPIDVQYGKAQTMSCSSRTSSCSPLWAGISISQSGQSSSQSSTMSYRSYDASNNVGFVIAGHAAGYKGQTIVQPGGSSTSVGTVEYYCYTTLNYYCDFAFVEASSGVSVANSIYQSSNTAESITSYTSGSSQSVGTVVTFSGLTSGISTGTISSNSPNYPYILVSGSIASGDSGSPVYVDGGSSGADLYGMAFLKVGSYYAYYPHDYISSQLGNSP